jgi:hypothetical protein
MGLCKVRRCLPVRVTALPYSFDNGPQAGNTLAVQLAMVGGEELQAKQAASSQGAELILLAQRQSTKNHGAAHRARTECGAGQQRTDTFPPLVGSGDMLWSLLPRYSAGKGVCEELRCRCSGFVFRRFLQSEGFRSVWCGFSGIVLGCLLQSCKVTALVAKELVLGWAKADAAKRAAPAWVPCDVEKMMMW